MLCEAISRVFRSIPFFQNLFKKKIIVISWTNYPVWQFVWNSTLGQNGWILVEFSQHISYWVDFGSQNSVKIQCWVSPAKNFLLNSSRKLLQHCASTLILWWFDNSIELRWKSRWHHNWHGIIFGNDFLAGDFHLNKMTCIHIIAASEHGDAEFSVFISDNFFAASFLFLLYGSSLISSFFIYLSLLLLIAH